MKWGVVVDDVSILWIVWTRYVNVEGKTTFETPLIDVLILFTVVKLLLGIT